jgi:hypothetical protein
MSFQFHAASEKFISQFELTRDGIEHHSLFTANRATTDMFSCYGEAEGAQISAVGTRYGQVILSTRNVRQTLFREPRDHPIELVRFNYSGNMVATFYNTRMVVINIRSGNTRCAIDLPSTSANITFAALTDENVFFCDSQFPDVFYCVDMRSGQIAQCNVPIACPRHFDDQLCAIGRGNAVEIFQDIATSMDSQVIDVGIPTTMDVKIAPGRVPLIWTLGSSGVACVNFATRRKVTCIREIPPGSELITHGDRCVVATRSGGSYMFQQFDVAPMFASLEPVGVPRIVEHPVFAEPTRFVYTQEGFIPFMQGAMFQIAIMIAMMQAASTGVDGLQNVEMRSGGDDGSEGDSEGYEGSEDSDYDDDSESESEREPEPSCGQQAVLDHVRASVQGINAWANVSGWSPAEFAQIRRCAEVLAGPRTKFTRSAQSGISATDQAIQKVQFAHDQLVGCKNDVVRFFGATDSMGVFEGDAEESEEEPEESIGEPMTRTEAMRIIAATTFDISAPDELVVSPTIRRDLMIAMVRHIYADDVMHTVNTGIVASLNVMISQLHDTLGDLRRHRTRLEKLVSHERRGVKRARSG